MNHAILKDILLNKKEDIFLKHKCPIAFSSIPIYRGFLANGSILYGNSLTYVRKSANTANCYTVLIDYFLKSWKLYPKRSRSFICSLDEDYASGYGNLYQVYPVGNPLIGICSSRDMWNSFKNISGPDINTMFRRLGNIFRINNPEDDKNIKNVIDFADKHWNDLKYSDDIKDTIDSVLFNPVMFLKDFENFTMFLYDLLSPVKNGFKLIKLSELKKHKSDLEGNEVWFSGPAYFKKMYKDVDYMK